MAYMVFLTDLSLCVCKPGSTSSCWWGKKALCMFVLILPTLEGWKADRVDFSGKGAGHPNTCIQPLTMPGNQPGDLWIGRQRSLPLRQPLCLYVHCYHWYYLNYLQPALMWPCSSVGIATVFWRSLVWIPLGLEIVSFFSMWAHFLRT